MIRAGRHCVSKLEPLISSTIYSLSRSPFPSPSQTQIPNSLPNKAFCFSSKPTARRAAKTNPCFSREGNYAAEEEVEEEQKSPPPNTAAEPFPSHHVCPGCGVHMQDSDPKSPGFFLRPSPDNKKPTRLGKARLWWGPLEPEFSDSLKRGIVVETEPEKEKGTHRSPESDPRPVVCARCHSLRHYGRVKDSSAENLLPEFDFDHTVGRKISASGGARSVVLAVVDSSDFDGSFPRRAAIAVSEAESGNSKAWKEGKPGNVPRLVLVATKIDLLPRSVGPTKLDQWVRNRAHEACDGLKLAGVHLVSSVRGWGVKNLIEAVATMAGPRGRVWAVGAQNAGKSTLINAMARYGGSEEEMKKKASFLTEAPVPGTTLGIVRVEGVLAGKAKLFDTPGLLHPHQITTRLTRDELALVNVSKELRPRTYRIKAGHSIHIAGLMRLDIEESSAGSIYVTVWASPYLPLHMGKTENALEMYDQHFGQQLQPPIGCERVKELGEWVRKEFRVSGNSWDASSVDIAAAGLGWFAIGLRGEAVLSAWTYDGIEVVLRKALIPGRARNFEVPGFSASKIVSRADQASNKSFSLSNGEDKRRLRETVPNEIDAKSVTF